MTTSNQFSALPTIDRDLLVTATGGDGDGADCTPDNPTGAPPAPTQFFENDHSGPSTEQRVIQNTDKAMEKWNLFNGLFGGFAAGAPRPGNIAPSRPTIR
jgi:hypothetical protein